MKKSSKKIKTGIEKKTVEYKKLVTVERRQESKRPEIFGFDIVFIGYITLILTSAFAFIDR